MLILTGLSAPLLDVSHGETFFCAKKLKKFIKAIDIWVLI
jgi:hypothetical protein